MSIVDRLNKGQPAEQAQAQRPAAPQAAPAAKPQGAPAVQQAQKPVKVIASAQEGAGDYDILTETQRLLKEAGFSVSKADIDQIIKKYHSCVVEAIFVNGELRIPNFGEFSCRINKPRQGTTKFRKDDQGNPIVSDWKSDARYTIHFRTFPSTREQIEELCVKYNEDPSREYNEMVSEEAAKAVKPKPAAQPRAAANPAPQAAPAQ